MRARLPDPNSTRGPDRTQTKAQLSTCPSTASSLLQALQPEPPGAAHGPLDNAWLRGPCYRCVGQRQPPPCLLLAGLTSFPHSRAGSCAPGTGWAGRALTAPFPGLFKIRPSSVCRSPCSPVSQPGPGQILLESSSRPARLLPLPPHDSGRHRWELVPLPGWCQVQGRHRIGQGRRQPKPEVGPPHVDGCKGCGGHFLRKPSPTVPCPPAAKRTRSPVQLWN